MQKMQGVQNCFFFLLSDMQICDVLVAAFLMVA